MAHMCQLLFYVAVLSHVITAGSTTASGKLFVVDEYGAENKVEIYDFRLHQWRAASSMRTPLTSFQAAAVGSMVYVVGGYSRGYSNATLTYDSDADKWDRVADMHVGRQMHAVVALNGVIYAIGGTTSKDLTAHVEAFNPKTNEWTTRAPLSSARCSVAAAAMGAYLYVAGGSELSSWSDNSQFLTVAEKYDPKNDVWSPLQPMMKGRQGALAAVVGEKFYVMSGHDYRDRSADVYDTASNTWTYVDSLLPGNGQARQSCVAGNGLIYLVGGYDHSDDPLLRSTSVYDPKTGSWSTLPANMTVGRQHPVVAFISSAS